MNLDDLDSGILQDKEFVELQAASTPVRDADLGEMQKKINEAIQQLDKVTQQNAGASEEMSATSEELAAQAEELQASIAYFRTDAVAGASAGRNLPPARPVQKRTASPPRRAAGKPAAKTAPTARAPVAAQQARAQGFALDLAKGGPDADDDDFKAYS